MPDRGAFHRRYYDQLEAPARLGHEYCGVVEAAGPGVTSPAEGSLVAGFDAFGGFGEVVTAAAGLFVPLPDGLPALLITQLARKAGAGRVILSAPDARRREQALALGADQVVDPAAGPLAEALRR